MILWQIATIQDLFVSISYVLVKILLNTDLFGANGLII